MTMLTSWHMLVGRAKIQPGQLVLIMGGGSGVGNYGIQIAKLFGCTVIATASPDKLDQLLNLVQIMQLIIEKMIGIKFVQLQKNSKTIW